MAKKVEVFTAGTYLCDDIVNRVNTTVCKRCEVIVYDLNRERVTPELEEKALSLDIQSIPAIVIDGKLEDIELLKKSKLGQMFHGKVVDKLLFHKKKVQ